MNDSPDAEPVATRPRMQAPASAIAATSGAAFDEAIALTRRLKQPHIRRAMKEFIPTAKAQRWESARDRAGPAGRRGRRPERGNLRTRRTGAAFPTGKTFHISLGLSGALRGGGVVRCRRQLHLRCHLGACSALSGVDGRSEALRKVTIRQQATGKD